MYKALWNHLDQNLKKAPAPAVFLALLTAGWSAAGILAGLLVCLELQTESDGEADDDLMCWWIRPGLIPGFFGGIFYLYRMDLRKPSADPVADPAAEAEKSSADPASLIYFHNN